MVPSRSGREPRAGATTVDRRALITLALAAAAAIPGCGESAEEQAAARRERARETVCSTSAAVAGQVRRLEAQSAAQLDSGQVLSELASIGVRLKRIRGALGDLNAAEARELRAAEAAFREQQFGGVVSGVVGGRTLGAENLEADLVPELDRLDAVWRRTMGRATRDVCR